MPYRLRRTPLAQAVYQASLDALRYIKRTHNYRKLAAILGTSPSTLSRYLSGKTLPRSRRAVTMLERIDSLIKYDEIVEEFFGGELDIENGIQICHDTDVIKLLSAHILRQFIGSKIDSVLAVDLHAVSMAVCFASLINSEVYFTLDRPVWRESFEITYRSDGGNVKNSIWLPKSLIRRGRSILLITTSVLSHSPYKEILNLIRDKRAYTAGLFTLVSRRSVWSTLSVTPGCKKVVVKLYT
ncbi:MAG: helix-turn-helix domain-containing protein [Nitrososphaerota archaeon]